MSKKLVPISGFPEFLPEEQLVMQRMMGIIRAVYESFGFLPIETPAVERVEHLLEKGVQGKEVYVLKRLADEDGGPSELALHFDLTVPLARYVAQHYGNLTFPFKRYQMQPVWRGERPQAGRYRQFYQSDVDIIGDGELSLAYDAEVCAVISEVFSRMEIGSFTIRLNHRKVLQGLLQSVGITEQSLVHQAIKIIDDMEKVPLEKSKQAFAALGLTEESSAKLLEFFAFDEFVDETLKFLSSLNIGTQFEAGVQELREMVKYLDWQGVPREHYKIDLKIARGLDYYTGMVYETVLDDYPQLGSICSGGRYEDLAGVFINRKLPGVGISIGLTRLIPQLLKEGILKTEGAATASLLVTMQNRAHIEKYFEIARRLRACGVATEVYLEPKKLGAQVRYADKKGIKWVIIADDPEFEKGVIIIKSLETGRQEEVLIESLEEKIVSII